MTNPEEERDDDGSSAQWIGVGIALGLSLGAAIGMLAFDNLALGAGLGLSLGIVFGVVMDALKKRRR